MSEGPESATERDLPRPPLAVVGSRIREVRLRGGMTLREFARRLNVSPSFVSQLETGKSQASVATLYSVCEVLDMPIDSLFGLPNRTSPGRDMADGSSPKLEAGPVVRPADRPSITLESGVIWEKLTRLTTNNVEFILAEYPVGSSSSGGEQLLRHEGTEYGYVLRGRLEVLIGFDRYVLEPGDAVSFDSTMPHRFTNIGDEPTQAVWFVLEQKTR
jgi:transcriptional regulator with XRE-family HTH domain